MDSWQFRNFESDQLPDIKGPDIACLPKCYHVQIIKKGSQVIAIICPNMTYSLKNKTIL
jgi:hypothetical protein